MLTLHFKFHKNLQFHEILYSTIDWTLSCKPTLLSWKLHPEFSTKSSNNDFEFAHRTQIKTKSAGAPLNPG